MQVAGNYRICLNIRVLPSVPILFRKEDVPYRVLAKSLIVWGHNLHFFIFNNKGPVNLDLTH